jgi:hypothetical protein
MPAIIFLSPLRVVADLQIGLPVAEPFLAVLLGFLFSAASAFSAPSALTPLFASCYLFTVICYPLCLGDQPIFLPPK